MIRMAIEDLDLEVNMASSTAKVPKISDWGKNSRGFHREEDGSITRVELKQVIYAHATVHLRDAKKLEYYEITILAGTQLHVRLDREGQGRSGV